MRIDAIAAAMGGIQRAGRQAPTGAPEPGRFDTTLRAAGATYRVSRGDTLSQIVAHRLKQLGSDASAQAIYDGVERVASANGIRNPDVIRVGQRIDLSALDIARPARSSFAESSEVSPPPPPRYSAQVPIPAPRVPPSPLEQAAAVPSSPRPASPPLLPEVAEIVVTRVTPRETVPVQTAALVSESRNALARPWETVLAAPARLTSEFGPRRDPFNGRASDHDGIDLAAPRGTKVHAIAPGRVTFSGWRRDYGNVVIVAHGNGLETLYGHHERNHVRTGDQVTSGTTLGAVGSTGRATAPHLHLEVRRAGEPVDPIPYMSGRTPLTASPEAGP